MIISEFLDRLYNLIWGIPLLVLVSGVGIYFTVALRGFQFRLLPYALRVAFFGDEGGEGRGDISHFQSLMTALAATIGIGNIAGVAMAVTIGGMGALFWMWMIALLGMATKYAEAYLAVKYRTVDDRGEMCGGPMYFIERGLGWRWLAMTFATFGAIAAFGGGNMLQANSVADVLNSNFQIDPHLTGIVLASLVGLTLFGGIKSIGKIAGLLVPTMAIIYLGGALIILATLYDRVPAVLSQILASAFSGQAACGGFLGAHMALALQTGISRGLMTSEAGLGTASIAAAAAKTDSPGQQALVSMTGSFLATIVMATVTGLVIGVTQVQGQMDAMGNLITGASLTRLAFISVFPWGGHVVTFGVVFFAFTTLIGWAYYGEKCVEYVLGERSVGWYRGLFTLIIIPGAILDLGIVWRVSDVANGLMAIPNLIGVAGLAGVVVNESREFLAGVDQKRRAGSGMVDDVAVEESLAID